MYSYVKRLGDFILSLGGIIFMSPLLLLLVLFIKLDSKGPILFCQKRVGINKSHFMIYKFRTMRIDTPKDTPTHLLKSPDQYITRAGKFLRRTSLDELPQLFNIIRGDMSVIGPRPALWNQYDLIEERDKYGANDIRPGLSGWAQVNGRDELPIPIKANLDGVYVKQMGFKMDCKIFFMTIVTAIGGKGLSEGSKVNQQ
ncbi:MAG: sugar transferase [Defluviitaleaceae bacterium]|nr:sugar transferase [Defluviitaleaceae bacterium]